MLDRTARGGDLFFRRVAKAIDQVSVDYDVVVIDCPPQLGYLTMGALNAATAMLVTIYPQMVDVASMSQFLLMTSDLMTVIEEAGGRLEQDFIRTLLPGMIPMTFRKIRLSRCLEACLVRTFLTRPFGNRRPLRTRASRSSRYTNWSAALWGEALMTGHWN